LWDEHADDCGDGGDSELTGSDDSIVGVADEKGAVDEEEDVLAKARSFWTEEDKFSFRKRMR
jgi:hypothetical protein